jgi:NAD(P)-dependent dehydrogenase (short-subunit alcohol dehydrogenase family)
MTSSFDGCKVVVVGGSSGTGKGAAAGVVAGGAAPSSSAATRPVSTRRRAELGKQGTAWGIAVDLADRAQVEAVREQFASGHADATLLVDAAGFFIPKPFLEYDGAFCDPSSTRIHPGHFWRKNEHSDRR